MHDTSSGVELGEQDVFAYQVSDAALETAAGAVMEKVNGFSLAFCSGLTVCATVAP